MSALKSISGVALRIAAVIGVAVAIFLLFAFGAEVAFTMTSFIVRLVGILLVVNVIVLLFAFAPRVRFVVGLVTLLSSYVYGLSAWIYGLTVTLALWGWLGVVVGVFLGGIGVVPVGMLASMFNNRWDIFWTLLLAGILTYIMRLVGYALVNSAESSDYKDDIIDMDVEDEPRTWKDFE